MLRALIADDHAVVRQGLKQIVGEMPGTMVVGAWRPAEGGHTRVSYRR